MILTYGSYSHDDGEVTVTADYTGLRDDRNRRYATLHKYTVKGRMLGTSASDLTTKINAMKSAYAKDKQDFELAGTSFVLKSNDCIGGTRILSGPRFMTDQPGAYTTFVDFEVEVGGEVENQSGDGPGSTPIVVEWTESLQFSGNGGPRQVWLTPLTGPPVPQLTSSSTTYRCVQRGNGSGLNAYPMFPVPLWPAYEMNEQRVTEIFLPQGTDTADRQFPISWQYVFESNVPFTGTPTPTP